MAPPLGLATTALTVLSILLQPSQALKGPKWFTTHRGNLRKEIEIHRIKSPNLSIHCSIDDPGINVDDPELYYDHCAELPGNPNTRNNVYYLATWKNEKTVIGIVAVEPHTWEEKENGDTVELSKPRGLFLDDVVVSKRYRRKGVATALLNAIEQDANKLMEIMEMESAISSMELKFVLNADERRRPGRRVELRLHSVRSREALGFYRSLGYQFEPWQDKIDEPPARFRKLKERLEWSRLCRTHR